MRPRCSKLLREMTVKNIALALGSLIIALLLMELVARWLGPPFEATPLDMHRCDRLTGWLGQPNLTTSVDMYGYEHEVVRNAEGMHDRDHQPAKAGEVFRIMLLGDSFVEASHVTVTETSRAILEQKLNQMPHLSRPIEVMNAGILAWGPAQELMYVRSRGLAFEPDLVIAMWVPANDLFNILPNHAFTAGGVNCYAPYFAICEGQFDRQPWFAVPGVAPVGPACSPAPGQKMVTNALSHLYAHSRLYHRLAPILPRHQLSYHHPYAPWLVAEQDDPMLTYAYQLTAHIYADLAQTVQPARTVLAIVPFNQAVYSEAWPHYAEAIEQQVPGLAGAVPRLPNQRFTALMTARGIPVLDLQPYFVDYLQRTGEDLHWREDFHWNVRGNQLVAEVLAEWLVEQALLPGLPPE